MKTITLFVLCLITFVAVLSVTFFYVPTLATQANSFLLSIPKRFETVAAWAQTNLSTIVAAGTATAVPIMYGANWLYKRASENTENKAKAQLAEMQQQVLDKNKTVLNLEQQAQAKDTLITQLQAGKTAVSDLTTKITALETQNLTLATERNQAKQLLEEWRLKYIPQEQKVK